MTWPWKRQQDRAAYSCWISTGENSSGARKRLICRAQGRSDNLIYCYVAASDKGAVAFSFQPGCGHQLIIHEKVESIKPQETLVSVRVKVLGS